jgi:glucose/arabinose dehydrogenase
VVVKADLPRDRSHGWKFIAFGPDGLLYVPIGAPCNICDRGDPYATINRMKPDGTGFEVVARGVRNTVGFDWHPDTRELWFTDNGRDMMGDDGPADELDRADRSGLHFGFPYCHGGDVPDPEFGRGPAVLGVRGPGAQAGPARGGHRHEVLHGRDVPGRVPRPDLHRRARVLEPQPQDRVSRHARAP